MRRFLIGLVFLAGCQGVVGPFQRTCIDLDDCGVPIDEQKQQERARLALPDVSPAVGPKTYSGNPNSRYP
jgi:hypothetical protein